MHILIAGASGPLGRQLIDCFLAKECQVTAMGLSLKAFGGLTHPRLTIKICDVTKPAELEGLCAGIDTVISCIGITRMSGKLTHMDVDYQGNLNLLKEARKQGVTKFGIITPVGAEHGLTHSVPLLEAKYKFKKALRTAGIEWLIFRSGGFFPDLAEMGRAAAKGTMFVIGSGKNYSTPVDVRDVARIMTDELLTRKNAVVEIGGPEDLSWNAICEACFAFYGNRPRLIHVPIWMCHMILPIVRVFSRSYYAMGKLILYMSTHNLPTEKRGARTFADYLREQRQK